MVVRVGVQFRGLPPWCLILLWVRHGKSVLYVGSLGGRNAHANGRGSVISAAVEEST